MDEGVAFPPSSAVVGVAAGLLLGTVSMPGMPGPWTWMASYMDWFFNEQRRGRFGQCALAMWVLRYAMVGGLGEVIAGSCGQALISIQSPRSVMVGSPS